jgi:hypothetical protein
MEEYSDGVAISRARTVAAKSSVPQKSTSYGAGAAALAAWLLEAPAEASVL